MARPMYDDLAPFQTWLKKNNVNMIPKTASVYASKVRRILKTIESVTEEELAEFAKQPENQNSIDLFLAAWNKFRAFMSDTKTLELPKMVKPFNGKGRSKRVDPPKTVMNLVWYLKNTGNVTYTRILDLTWKDVELRDGEYWEIVDPIQKGLVYRVPSALLREVKLWAFGDEDIIDENPIVVGEPFSKSVISKSHLSNCIKKYNETLETKQEEQLLAEITKEEDLVLDQEIMTITEDN